jgi:hypothetical protein
MIAGPVESTPVTPLIVRLESSSDRTPPSGEVRPARRRRSHHWLGQVRTHSENIVIQARIHRSMRDSANDVQLACLCAGDGWL